MKFRRSRTPFPGRCLSLCQGFSGVIQPTVICSKLVGFSERSQHMIWINTATSAKYQQNVDKGSDVQAERS
jgi:hypothetical protein